MTGAPKVVVLGLMTKMPVAGVMWQTLHYLLGFERLGYEAYYVEAHARTPSMLMRDAGDDSAALAAAFIDRFMRGAGLAGRWAFHALHDDGRCYGMERSELDALYRDAAFVLNLHGGTEPRPEHYASGRLVYLETDPGQLQIELHQDEQRSIDFLEPHCAFFTFGENYGSRDCLLPLSDRFRFVPTRQPVIVDLWSRHALEIGAVLTTVGNWRQDWRPVDLGGETYHWSKHREWEKVLDLPARTGASFELALSSITDDDRGRLEGHGWRVVPGLGVSGDADVYRRYIAGSMGELTVAKDQNVRLRTGWFSDRSATYLAAGRPVITQDTGFGAALPTGVGLLPWSDVDEAADAVAAVLARPAAHCRAASEIAATCFSHEVVLGDMLEHLGLPRDRRARTGPTPPGPPFSADLRLTPLSRRPVTLEPAAVAAVLGLPLTQPETAPARLRRPGRPVVSVVVVTFNGLAFTRLCLESLLRFGDELAYEVVVVDNGSTDGTLAYLKGLVAAWPALRVVPLDENRGFPAGANVGLAEAEGDVLVLANNDVIPSPGWLSALAWHVAEHHEKVAVGPTTNRIGNEAEIPVSYETYGDFLRFAERRAESQRHRSFSVDRLAMFCFALTRAAFEAVGPLDEGFGVGLFEDDDYCRRLREAGYGLRCAEDVFVHHVGEASFGRLYESGSHGDIFDANRRRFEAKWGEPWRPAPSPGDASRDRIRALVAPLVVPGSSVLVIGRGDEGYLQLGESKGAHFPQMPDGTYAGHYPATADDAVAHLEELREQGADYLLVPASSAWWLEHYAGFGAHLVDRYEVVAAPGAFTLFSLKERAHV